MNKEAQLRIIRAASSLAAMRVGGAVAIRHLAAARQMSPLPEGSIDLFDDLEAVQRTLERLQKQIDAMSVGQPLPA